MKTATAATAVAPRVSNKEIHSTKGTPSTDPKKGADKKKNAEKKLTEANTQKAEMKVEEAKERDVVYNYPADAKSQLDKKSFRRKARAARKAFEKSIASLSKAEGKEAKKELHEKEAEFKAWKAVTYTKGDR